MHPPTALFSALLALPLALAAPNFRLHPGTVRRTAREPREWRRQDEPVEVGSRFVRLDMRRKAPTHNLVPAQEDDDEPALDRRASTIIIDEHAEPTSSSSFVPSSSSSDDGFSTDIFSFTSSVPEPSQTPSPARVNATAMLKDVAYGVKIWIGYPEQAVTLDFDTGSSETWVSPPCTPLTGVPIFEEICRAYGQYLPEHSQSGFHVDPNLCPNRWISYGSGAVYVSYYRDIIRVNDPASTYEPPMVLENPVQFGVSSWAEGMDSGIMGVAYGAGYNQNYTGFIDALYNQNLIAHKDFSVSLGSVGKDVGEVVFGGLDKSKFVGPLHALPLATQYTLIEDGFYRYWLDVTYIGVTAPGGCTSQPLTNSSFSARFLPDTGTTLTYMPEEVFFALMDFFPDAHPAASYGYIIDCDHLNDQGSIDFGFGEFTIHVPIREFIFQVPPMFDSDGPDTICVVGAVPTSDFFILGDTFLRSVVALFRQQEHKVYLAQYMNCGVNIVETHANMSGMLGDCGHRRTKREHPAHIPGQKGGNPDKNILLEENQADQADQAFMTCATYLTGEYTPISSAPWTSESYQHNLFPRPAMQTVNRDRQGPPPAMATATAAGNDKLHRRAAMTAAMDAAKATTSCVTATETAWVAESFSSEYPISSSPPSNYTTITETKSIIFTAETETKYTGLTTETETETKTKIKTKTKTKPFTTTCTFTASASTLGFTEYPSSSISSAMASYTSGPATALTIPIQSDETVVVKLKTTTYTIVDGVTQTPSFVPEESSTTGSTWTYSANSSALWTGYSSESSSFSLVTESPVATTTTGYSTSVSGEPDGYISAWSWTADAGTTTEESAPWVTDSEGVVPRGDETCVCMDFGWCRCSGKVEEGEGDEAE